MNVITPNILGSGLSDTDLAKATATAADVSAGKRSMPGMEH